MPFVVASMLISLAVLPVALTRKKGPTIGSNSYLPIRALYAISPLGIVGAAVTGVMLGAFYGLGAVYARELGLSVSATAWFMTTVILGGVVSARVSASWYCASRSAPLLARIRA